METNVALKFARDFLRIYWQNESALEEWSRQLEAEHGLTAKQYGLLRAVERQADMTTTDLTVLLGKAQPAITQMLNRLQKNGFVTREQSPVDKRKRELKLTAKAHRVLDTVDPVGPTRLAMGLEHATEREAAAIVKAIELINEWMTRRPLPKR